jgi:DNA-binding response OmpR family regulator
VRVLVVDDEPDLRMILRINLQRWGHDVVLAADAAEAWAVLADGEGEGQGDGQGVDAMLLDVSMPGETGLQLLGRLREAGRVPRQVALLSAMVSGALPPGAEGVRFLAKPFGIEELRALVVDMAGAGSGG